MYSSVKQTKDKNFRNLIKEVNTAEGEVLELARNSRLWFFLGRVRKLWIGEIKFRLTFSHILFGVLRNIAHITWPHFLKIDL